MKLDLMRIISNDYDLLENILDTICGYVGSIQDCSNCIGCQWHKYQTGSIEKLKEVLKTYKQTEVK